MFSDELSSGNNVKNAVKTNGDIEVGFRKKVPAGLADSFKNTRLLGCKEEIDIATDELFKAHKYNSQHTQNKECQALLIQDSEKKLAKILGKAEVNSSFEKGKLYIDGKETNLTKQEHILTAQDLGVKTNNGACKLEMENAETKAGFVGKAKSFFGFGKSKSEQALSEVLKKTEEAVSHTRL